MNGGWRLLHPPFLLANGTVEAYLDNPSMTENRRLRFHNLPTVGKDEIALACEVWLDDLVRSPWATREVMKLGAHMVNYIQSANQATLQFREIETIIQLNREEVNRTINSMKLFRVVKDFAIDKDEIKANLHLSTSQIMRILEMRIRCLQFLSNVPIGAKA